MERPGHRAWREEITAGDRGRDAPPCMSCGSDTAVWFSTPDGRARLCPPCATLHGLGCP